MESKTTLLKLRKVLFCSLSPSGGCAWDMWSGGMRVARRSHALNIPAPGGPRPPPTPRPATTATGPSMTSPDSHSKYPATNWMKLTKSVYIRAAADAALRPQQLHIRCSIKPQTLLCRLWNESTPFLKHNILYFSNLGMNEYLFIQRSCVIVIGTCCRHYTPQPVLAWLKARTCLKKDIKMRSIARK